MRVISKVMMGAFLFGLFFWQSAQCQIKLPQLISDSMILQRDSPLKIWGWASPGEKISVTFNGKRATTLTGSNGKWLLKLPAMKAGGPYQMKLQGKNQLILNGILIGDVWLCSGQSNMVHQMKLHAIRYQEDIENAHYPQIRQFWVPTATNLIGPQEHLPKSSWKSANPEDVKDFSAVAYFFARNVYQHHSVPIGIINSSVGGTPIEAWISEEGLRDFNAIQETITKNKDTSYINSRNRVRPSQRRAIAEDKGLTESIKWFDNNYQPKGWRTINVPGYWEDQGISNLNGVVWYRKEINIGFNLQDQPGRLFLGRIIDADEVYLNGQKIGSTSYQYPQRIYTVPAGLLKKGTNTLVVRVENNAGKGGFVPNKPYYMELGDQTEIDLKGTWEYKVGQVNRPVDWSDRREGPVSAQNQPTALYNAMVAPFLNYGIKGVLWYQGESNVGNAPEYEKLLPAIMNDWRTGFSNSGLPFYYVQLPNFGDMTYLPVESGWAAIRETSLKALKIPHTGMAVTIDLGEWNDIHPDRKKEVGDRLALIARHFDYDEKDLVYSGPLYQSSETKGNKIVLNFTHTGSGLISIDGEELSEFAIAGADKKFVWAKAHIVGDQIEVWSDEVPDPRYVRYAWADNPVNPNLYNKEKLPASPFRTDQ